MIQVNVHEAKTHLSRLIEAALEGKSVTIARAGRPVVDLVAHQVPTVVIGVDGWQDYRSDPSLFDGPDAEIDDLFYGAPAS
ncbi:type II toxin-antitoxin system prevent-host-death family antitoxin [Pseudactinotalea sp. HY160]|uniref:type II toxin-antitoxin system Phd/YefM family antitoxin n=1 Tax=Pseudactinotalea sp. HY160 TaxID=2654490 RepID=UPI00128DBDB9|nr:type II toxin-antitoxin system prevent-host-death family antitoxin [Pseudactinotalea sp. HY160]MPV50645.1 type II toxin-antitoxin system prevent-host-death family antitoxin [Pseudactinotalea sp. HY160]